MNPSFFALPEINLTRTKPVQPSPHTELLVEKKLWSICAQLEPPRLFKTTLWIRELVPTDHYGEDVFDYNPETKEMTGTCWASSRDEAIGIAVTNRQVFIEQQSVEQQPEQPEEPKKT
jgi:hypothetical protein